MKKLLLITTATILIHNSAHAENYQYWDTFLGDTSYIDTDTIKIKKDSGYYMVGFKMKTSKSINDKGYSINALRNTINQFNQLGCCANWKNSCSIKLNSINSSLKSQKGQISQDGKLTKYLCSVKDKVNDYSTSTNQFIINKKKDIFYLNSAPSTSTEITNNDNQTVFKISLSVKQNINDSLAQSFNITEQLNKCRLNHDNSDHCVGYSDLDKNIRKYLLPKLN